MIKKEQPFQLLHALDMHASVAANKEPMNEKERAANVMSMTTIKRSCRGSSLSQWLGWMQAYNRFSYGIGDEKNLMTLLTES
jgi:hypothetical protein